jgi:hypothetical protein
MSQNNKEHWIHKREKSPLQFNFGYNLVQGRLRILFKRLNTPYSIIYFWYVIQDSLWDFVVAETTATKITVHSGK